MTKDRMIDILAEVCDFNKLSLSSDLRKLIMAEEALTAMQRVAQEVELSKKNYVQGYIDERDHWVRNWNHLDKMYQHKCDELATLRAEVDRLNMIIDNIKKLNRYDVDVEDYGDDGCSLSVDLIKYGRWVEYDELIELLEHRPPMGEK